MKPISDDIFLTLNTRPDLNYNEDYSSKSESPSKKYVLTLIV